MKKWSVISVQLSVIIAGCAAEPKPRPVSRQAAPAIAVESAYSGCYPRLGGRPGHGGTLVNWRWGDGDYDGDVDADDLVVFDSCYSGPGIRLRDMDPDGTPSACWMFDADRDLDVDAVDFAAMQRSMGR